MLVILRAQGFTSVLPCEKIHRGLKEFEHWNFLPAGCVSYF